MKFIPHTYQKMAIQKICDTPRAGLFLDMGLGKTVITLTAIDELMYNRFEIERVLVSRRCGWQRIPGAARAASGIT